MSLRRGCHCNTLTVTTAMRNCKLEMGQSQLQSLQASYMMQFTNLNSVGDHWITKETISKLRKHRVSLPCEASIVAAVELKPDQTPRRVGCRNQPLQRKTTNKQTKQHYFHLLKPTGKYKSVSSSDRFPVKPTGEIQQYSEANGGLQLVKSSKADLFTLVSRVPPCLLANSLISADGCQPKFWALLDTHVGVPFHWCCLGVPKLKDPSS